MMYKVRSLIVLPQLNNSLGLETFKLTRLPHSSRSLDHPCDRCYLGRGENMVNHGHNHTKQYASINTNDMNCYKRSDENAVLR